MLDSVTLVGPGGAGGGPTGPPLRQSARAIWASVDIPGFWPQAAMYLAALKLRKQIVILGFALMCNFKAELDTGTHSSGSGSTSGVERTLRELRRPILRPFRGDSPGPNRNTKMENSCLSYNLFFVLPSRTLERSALAGRGRPRRRAKPEANGFGE